jgi:hypothetical protein
LVALVLPFSVFVFVLAVALFAEVLLAEVLLAPVLRVVVRVAIISLLFIQMRRRDEIDAATTLDKSVLSKHFMQHCQPLSRLTSPITRTAGNAHQYATVLIGIARSRCGGRLPRATLRGEQAKTDD